MGNASLPWLIVSFSGGRTSAYMAKRLKDEWGSVHNILFVFMNTGQEHEKTLEFVKRCDEEFGLNLIWIEAEVIHGKRVSSNHKFVDFETASRQGEPFEEVIRKYGIPNQSFPHCNRELKLNPFKSLKSALGLHDAETAVGIRVDEMDRMSSKAESDRIVYPLVSWFPTTKQEVIDWWKKQPFDLGIPEHHGNCLTCWKKSKRKLLTIAKHNPEFYRFTAKCEALYPDNGAGEGGRVFFREYQDSFDLLRESKHLTDVYVDGNHDYDADLDAANGCSESCDVFADE